MSPLYHPPYFFSILMIFSLRYLTRFLACSTISLSIPDTLHLNTFYYRSCVIQNNLDNTFSKYISAIFKWDNYQMNFEKQCSPKFTLVGITIINKHNLLTNSRTLPTSTEAGISPVSIMSPTLFSLHINDILSSMSNPILSLFYSRQSSCQDILLQMLRYVESSR